MTQISELESELQERVSQIENLESQINELNDDLEAQRNENSKNELALNESKAEA